MERGLVHFTHSAIIGTFLYLFMFYGLRQSQPVAEKRSILIAACLLIYMILFGHGLPVKLNRNV